MNLDCEEVEWSVEVPDGRYEVSITVGDIDSASYYSLTVNHIYVYQGEFLKEDQFETKSEIVNVDDGKIVIRAECDT